MEKAFQEYVRGLVRELHSAIRVEFLPARDIVHSDPIYPVRFETETASLMVGFPQRMVLSTERKAEVRDTIARVVRLLGYFRGKPAVGMVSQAGSGLD